MQLATTHRRRDITCRFENGMSCSEQLNSADARSVNARRDISGIGREIFARCIRLAAYEEPSAASFKSSELSEPPRAVSIESGGGGHHPITGGNMSGKNTSVFGVYPTHESADAAV